MQNRGQLTPCNIRFFLHAGRVLERAAEHLAAVSARDAPEFPSTLSARKRCQPLRSATSVQIRVGSPAGCKPATLRHLFSGCAAPGTSWFLLPVEYGMNRPNHGTGFCFSPSLPTSVTTV